MIYSNIIQYVSDHVLEQRSVLVDVTVTVHISSARSVHIHDQITECVLDGSVHMQ
jgi:hypothetical protein